MTIGPLDRRALKTRCQACAKRRIKCVGSQPCVYCTKKNMECKPQLSLPSAEIVFVNARLPPIPPSRQVVSSEEDIALNRFFAVFMTRNDFSGEHLDSNVIISAFQSSPSLYHAALAIGSLDLGRTPSLESRRKLTASALLSYQRSIITFKSDMQKSDLRKSDAALWTTFFLGLFELMYDVTGEGWVKHILYGTSSILRFRGPEAHLSGSGRTFFLSIRLFEICRSLIYSEPSFLSRPEWKSMAERLWIGKGDRHPKEELFDLMLSGSALGCSVWEALKPDLDIFDDLALCKLVTEGHQLRTLLENWQKKHAHQVPHEPCDNPWLFLSSIYYHALSIYLSGIYDYRPQFDHMSPPNLPQDSIRLHVTKILTKIENALRTTNLAGILFFFPLRVAGARAWSVEQRLVILRMLTEISKRAYIVADAFILDLNTLWDMNRNRQDFRRAWH